MPLQGESTGIALEDVIVFARTLQAKQQRGLPEVLAAY